jgi:hypothetical protein
MKKEHVFPVTVTYNTILDACAKKKDPIIFHFFEEMKLRSLVDGKACNVVMNFLLESNQLENAMKHAEEVSYINNN